MAYWFLDKKSGEGRIFGSISAICANSDLKPDALYFHFSRKKKTEWESERYRILKRNVERGQNVA